MTERAIIVERRRSFGIQSGWFAVGVLTIAYAVCFVDRQIVNLLVEPLKHDLQIQDSQIGLLQGVGFGIFYTILGLPMGWLADRVHRVRLIAAGIALWSGMTMACGLASSFGGLFLARMGVGIGEAALVPAAISLLADVFDPRERALPMSVFTAGVAVGSGLALALGGVTIIYAGQGAHSLPLIGAWFAQIHPWQTTFVLVGFIGLPVAALTLAIGEPIRRGPHGDDPVEALGGLVHHLKANPAPFFRMLLGVGLLYIVANADSAWIPSIFIREFGWQPSETGKLLALPIIIGAVSGALASGSIATWLTKRGAPAGAFQTMAMSALFLFVPISALVPVSPTPGLALFGIGFMFMATGLTFAVATATFVAITPNRLRGQMVALYLMIGNLLGLGLGPYSVGLLLDHVLRNPNRVGEALLIVALVAGVPGALLFRSTRASYAALRLRMEEG